MDYYNILEELLENWEDEDYKGIRSNYIKHDIKYNYDEIINNKITYDTTLSKYINNVNINDYISNFKGLYKFLTDLNFKADIVQPLNKYKYYRIMGYHPSEYIQKFIDNVPKNAKYIIDLGFQHGMFAIECLLNNPNVIVISFDLGISKDSWYTKYFIDNKFPGRHILLYGDIQNNIEILNSITNKNIDVIFIYDYPLYMNKLTTYKHVIKLMSISNENTVLLFESICPHNSWGYRFNNIIISSYR